MFQIKFLQTAVLLLGFFISVAQTGETSLEKVTQKLENKKYVGSTLKAFHKDFRSLLKLSKYWWIDEPPGKLRGAYFELKNSEAVSVKVYFQVIPDSLKYNEQLNWTMKSIENSKISFIEVLKSDSIILAFPK